MIKSIIKFLVINQKYNQFAKFFNTIKYIKKPYFLAYNIGFLVLFLIFY